MTDQNTSFNDKVKLDQQALEKFVMDLIKEKNSPYVNEKNINEVKDEMLINLSNAINRKMIENLTDEKVTELNNLLEKKTGDEEVAKFFSVNIGNMEELMTQVLIDFRKGYLSVVYQPDTKPQTPAPAVPPSPPPAPVGDKKIVN